MRSIAGLAEAFGGRVVAEGVETPEGLAVLEELGVQLGQGFLFRRPAPIGELLRGGFAARAALAG